MKFDEAYSGNVFIAAHPHYEDSEVIIFGMPMDFTVSYRPGSRFGPKKIREVSLGLEEYSPYLDRELTEVKYFDAGDIPLPFGNSERSVEMIGDYVSKILHDGKFPLGLGGEHLVAWPIIREVYKKYPDLILLHFDAHCDLRTDYEGEPYSHATPIRKATELIGGENVYQFGIRSGLKEEFEFAKEYMNFYPFEVLEPLKQVLTILDKKRPVYITIDIDVLDPAFAPGTGTLESGGITSKEMLAAIHEIARSGIQVVGADIVEVAPVYDPADQTAILASKMVREILLGWVKA
ncbi:agmatinase [Tepidibacillus marianensis]|uniref:agmatinase n=1 Tax=Tepidibacillus marianensis TaxID=3131995 RepID=UPI0030D1F475